MKSLIPFLLTLFLAISFWLEGQAKDTERPSVLLINVDDWNDWNSVLKGIRRRLPPILSSSQKRGSLLAMRFVLLRPASPRVPLSLLGLPRPVREIFPMTVESVRGAFMPAPETITIPKLFSQNGWESIGIAKNFHRGDAPEFDTYIPPFKTPKKLKKVGLNLNSSAIWDIADMPVSEMGDYKAASAAIKTIQSQKGPLFLSVGIYRPHVPWIVPQAYFDMYPPSRLSFPSGV